MGFIKGRAYPIISAMAKDGNEKAKKLLEGVDSMDQDQVDSMISEIFDSQEKPVGKGILQKEITQGKGRRVRSRDFDYYEQKSREEKKEIDDIEKKYGKDVADIMREGKKLGQPMDVNNAISIADQRYKEKAKLEKTVVPIMPRGGLSEEQQADLKELDQAKTTFPSLKQKPLTQKVKDIAKQVKGQDGTYKIENGQPQKVELNKGFSVSFFRPEIKNEEAEEIEKIIGDQLGSQYVGVYGGNGELSYNVDQKTANFMAYIFNQKSVWDNKLQKEVDNPNYDPNIKVDYKQAIKELKQLFIDKDLKGV